jgi:hypothetical protein
MIFNRYLEGYTTKEIKYNLEKHSINTRRENDHWSPGSIQVILKNPSYTRNETFTDKKTGQV